MNQETNELSLSAAPVDMDVLKSLTTASPFKFLKLCDSSSGEAKQGFGQAGQILITNKDKNLTVSVGEATRRKDYPAWSFKGILLAYRWKATLYENGKFTETSYNPRSPVFQGIRNRPKSQDIVPHVGPECLYYIPPHMINVGDLQDRGISPVALGQFVESLQDGILGVFHYAKSNAECSYLTEGMQLPLPVFHGSQINKGPSYTWYKTEFRETFDPADEPWYEEALTSGKVITQDAINNFNNPVDPSAGIEAADSGTGVSR